jgi:hypothetical protein
VTWTPRENNRKWTSVASSSDGSKLVAAAYEGQIYTSIPATTPGETGVLTGDPEALIELQYVNNGQWRVLSFQGTINAQ